MNSLSLPAAKPTICHRHLNPNRTALRKPLSSVSFRLPSSPLPNLSYSTIKASLQNHENLRNFSKSQTETIEIQLNPFLSPLKSTLVTTVAAAAIILSRFCFPLRPCIAATVAPPVVEMQDSIAEGEKEKSLEEHLISYPDDTDALKSLMEIKIKSKDLKEAIKILDKLRELEPEEAEWPMMKSHLYAYNEEFELAKNGFSEMLKKDPFRVEAYHGLVTVASQEESTEDLENIEKRVEEAMKLCKKENKLSDYRDFKLLFAQIRVLEGRYDEALGVYQDLVKEEPRDFRPYLCQGIIYTLLRKDNEAQKSFDKYKRLVPKGHPYASYFDDNMIATKIFAQRAENERAMAKSGGVS